YEEFTAEAVAFKMATFAKATPNLPGSVASAQTDLVETLGGLDKLLDASPAQLKKAWEKKYPPPKKEEPKGDDKPAAAAKKAPAKKAE
ncbi:hypothetical protein TeGR_g151, partial [Tetraparma gracilis]